MLKSIFVDPRSSDASRRKALEAKKTKLKRLYADAMPNNAGLKELLAKNGDARREAGSSDGSHGEI